MMRWSLWWLLLGVGTLLAEPQQVLMIGNSYTGHIRGAMRSLAAADAGKVELSFFTPGGKQLVWHAENEKTLATLRSRRWDVVVLQDQSQTPAYMPKKFRDGATALAKVAREQGARVILYQTWGRRDGDKRNAKIAPTYEVMQKMLTANYLAVGKELNCEVARVGEAWSRIAAADGELFQRLYAKDGSHPAAAGGYLAASVIYQQITGTLPTGKGAPKEVGEDDAKQLLKAAQAVKAE